MIPCITFKLAKFALFFFRVLSNDQTEPPPFRILSTQIKFSLNQCRKKTQTLFWIILYIFSLCPSHSSFSLCYAISAEEKVKIYYKKKEKSPYFLFRVIPLKTLFVKFALSLSVSPPNNREGGWNIVILFILYRYRFSSHFAYCHR